ncbi:MAG: amidohydrolase, partial [Actinomycetota bacterium]|nr:amidohydrolase [Actinomycetota bacterium]
TRVVRERLTAAGLFPRVLPGGTGLICDVGAGDTTVALRADLDALPVADLKSVPYRSSVDGVCHACGHDVHTTVVLGAGLVLHELAREGRLPGRVRLLFQPAEEMTPGGALDVLAAGALDGVDRILALHCDPRTEVGQIGLRAGPITAAADNILVRLSGPGGHTARPHLTGDLVHALATVATGLPAALSRRVDPRAGLSVVWGRISAGRVRNAIPESGEIEGTLRCLDTEAWQSAPEMVRELVRGLSATYGVRAEVEYARGVPPVVNEATSVQLLAAAARATEGSASVVPTEQSLGGEDFSWYLHRIPGALARLGVGTPDDLVVRDLHQGTFDVDERAIAVGVRVLCAAALLSL